MWVCLWIVYLVWGSTYLAIRVTVETIPPLLGMGTRFLAAGAIAFLWLLLRRGRERVRVKPRELVACTIVGGALLLGGNGIVSVAEQEIPSGLAALILASIPLWVALLRRFWGERIGGHTLAAVGVGFAGVALLAVPQGIGGGVALGGIMLAVFASLSWASGSFFSSRLPLPADPLLSTAVQMLCGGALLVLSGAATGEVARLETSSFSAASLWALAYLITIGSLLAFTAYTWLLQNAPISKVSTYAYVNPVVAVFLGWLILSEEVTPTILAGAALVVASVAYTVRRGTSESTTNIKTR